MSDFEHLWNGTTPGWSLLDANPGAPTATDRYMVYNTETRAVLLIEEENEKQQVVAELMRRGARVVTIEEIRR